MREADEREVLAFRPQFAAVGKDGDSGRIVLGVGIHGRRMEVWLGPQGVRQGAGAEQKQDEEQVRKRSMSHGVDVRSTRSGVYQRTESQVGDGMSGSWGSATRAGCD